MTRRSVDRAVSGDEKSVDIREEPLVEIVSSAPCLPSVSWLAGPYLGLLIDAATAKLADAGPAGFNDLSRELRWLAFFISWMYGLDHSSLADRTSIPES